MLILNTYGISHTSNIVSRSVVDLDKWSTDILIGHFNRRRNMTCEGHLDTGLSNI